MLTYTARYGIAQSQRLKIEHIHFIEHFTTLYTAVEKAERKREQHNNKGAHPNRMTREDMSEITKKEGEREKKWNRHTFAVWIFVNREAKKTSIEKCDANVAKCYSLFYCRHFYAFFMCLWILWLPACLPAVQSVIFQSTTRLYIFNLCDCNCFPCFQLNANCVCVCVCVVFKLCAALLSSATQTQRLAITAIMRPYTYEYWSQIVSVIKSLNVLRIWIETRDLLL